MNRPLTEAEVQLARWMLENGTAMALTFLGQIEQAEVTSWRCQCGCASINFQIKDQPAASAGVTVLGDYIYGDSGQESGAFIFERGGLLSGIEVYGLSGDAPAILTATKELRAGTREAQPN